MYMNSWPMGGMWFFWIAAIILIVLAVVFLAKTLQGPRAESSSPERILKQRFAHGDISKEEYDQKLADIRR